MKSTPIVRPLVRCVVPTCRRWWSAPHDATEVVCACGGALEVVDMDAHRETLPYTPMKPPEPKKK